MPYQLKVVFRGPMVLVPSAAIDQPQPWFGAFLVNADQTSLSNLGQDRTLRLHFPFVRYDLAALKGAPAGIDGKGYWELAGEDVVIRPTNPSGGPLMVNHSSTGIGTTPAPGEEGFLDWVPKVSDLLGNGNVLPACLQTGGSNEVVARVHMSEGMLQSETLSNFNQEDAIVQFTHLSSGGVKIRRVVATSVSLTMPGLTGDLELRARQYGPGNVRRLVFTEPASGNLEIEVINLCADEMQDPLPSQFPDLDSDFAWNYLVTEAGNPLLLQNSPLRLPLAVEFDPGDAGGGEYAKCTYPQASQISANDLTTMQAVANF